MSAFSTLLSPLTVGPVTLPNRVVSTAHQTTLVHDHLPTDDFVAYHGARAQGGAGGIFLGATAVHPTGLLTAHTLGGYLPAIVGGYERVAEVVKRHRTRLFVQLFHGGREQIAAAPRAAAVAPSAVPSPRFHSEPRALTRAEIAEIVAGFAHAAVHARAGGLDGVEVSMAHGYLAAQFSSPRANHREDDYGGDLEARLRFGTSTSATATSNAWTGPARASATTSSWPPSTARPRCATCSRAASSRSATSRRSSSRRAARPDDALWHRLEGVAGAVRAGDVLGPRTAEEAVLEGFLAGRATLGLAAAA